MSKQINEIDTHKRKGGRPPKSEDDKHTNRQSINFTDDELTTVDYKANKAGKRRVNYIHDAALNAHVKSHINDEQVLLVRKVANMGNNLNQIARRANQGGLRAIQAVAEDTLGRLSELINRILRGGDLSGATRQ